MAMSIADLTLILRLRERGALPARGKVLEIGAQQLLDHILTDTMLRDQLGSAFEVEQWADWWSPNLADTMLSARILWNWL
ncbi:MAG TPA: hypothetical protein VH722_17910, partial [Alphaproteobacteria bacterium]|nr:hypothetical protein [Alphaproteobacteria bacterium]